MPTSFQNQMMTRQSTTISNSFSMQDYSPNVDQVLLNAFKKRLTTAISTQIDNYNVVALHNFINMNYQLTGI